MRLHICADLGGGGGKTLASTLLVLITLIGAAVLALKPTPAEAHPCLNPTQSLGIVDATVVQEYLLHDGDCVTRVNGNPRWMASFDFELAERRTVQIDLENVANVDPYLRLLDESGTIIAFDDDSGDGRNARISRELDRGRYRIQATKYDAPEGTVRLTINVGPRSTSSSSPAVVRSLAAGAHHTCALLADGQLRCWGWNEDGQSNARLGTFASVSAGLSHTCAIDTTEALRCWGETTGVDGYPPIPAAPEGSFTQVSAAFGSTCAVTTSSGVQCWGFDNWGQATAPAGQFAQVTVAAFHTCALTTAGSIQCWGRQVGGPSDPPTGAFTQISASMFYNCALKTNGEVQCWGEDFVSGQTNSPAGRFTQVAAGTSQACALTTGGEVRCWGGDSEPPTGRFSQVAVGAYHVCALRQDGAVECWGSNDRGQLDIPEDLAAPTAAVAVCPEPGQLFHVTRSTSTSGVRQTKPARLDTDCQVDGLPGGRVRPADHYEFTLDHPAHVSAKLVSDEFAPHLFLTDAGGQYYYLAGTEAEGGTWLSLSGSRAANGDGNAIITQANGEPGGLQPAAFGLRLEPGSYWLFAVSANGSRAGNYQLEVEYERIRDSGLHQQIAERFAPVILFEKDEEYFPVPVELMVELSTLHYTLDGRAGSKMRGTYGLADLISHNGQNSYLNLPDDDTTRARSGDRVVYARVAEASPELGGTLVQYWFFYLYNKTGGGGTSHEGDWEGIQLWFADLYPDDLLTATVPTQIGYAAHENGWAFRQNAESCANSGVIWPRVYVARNRHASYFGAGGGGPIAQLVRGPYSLDKSLDKQDQYHGNGAAWALQGRDVPDVTGELGYEIRMLPTDLKQSWLAWNGRWGDESGAGGPLGPVFKSHFWIPPVNNGWSQAEFTCRDRGE